MKRREREKEGGLSWLFGQEWKQERKNERKQKQERKQESKKAEWKTDDNMSSMKESLENPGKWFEGSFRILRQNTFFDGANHTMTEDHLQLHRQPSSNAKKKSERPHWQQLDWKRWELAWGEASHRTRKRSRQTPQLPAHPAAQAPHGPYDGFAQGWPWIVPTKTPLQVCASLWQFQGRCSRRRRCCHHSLSWSLRDLCHWQWATWQLHNGPHTMLATVGGAPMVITEGHIDPRILQHHLNNRLMTVLTNLEKRSLSKWSLQIDTDVWMCQQHLHNFNRPANGSTVKGGVLCLVDPVDIDPRMVPQQRNCHFNMAFKHS